MQKLSFVLALVIGLFTATSAFAHSKLVNSKPADGSMLMEGVPAIELQFSAPVRLMKVELRGSAAGDIAIDFKPAAESAQKYSVKIPALAVDSYEVHWVAMGPDGHKMSGNFGFMQHGSN
ncbi:copper resistance CopC family protein [uncultured Microbulbifer sp.]|uniref:copper resistance CopC family protein n=1 Tax=uncultured Microbulbifer sp. TaxID=348147 RepID=UPI0025F72076|nr:copper resistance CopC family protein [uncultured Microbulbifer sp.]